MDDVLGLAKGGRVAPSGQGQSQRVVPSSERHARKEAFL